MTENKMEKNFLVVVVKEHTNGSKSLMSLKINNCPMERLKLVPQSGITTEGNLAMKARAPKSCPLAKMTQNMIHEDQKLMNNII